MDYNNEEYKLYKAIETNVMNDVIFRHSITFKLILNTTRIRLQSIFQRMLKPFEHIERYFSVYFDSAKHDKTINPDNSILAYFFHAYVIITIKSQNSYITPHEKSIYNSPYIWPTWMQYKSPPYKSPKWSAVKIKKEKLFKSETCVICLDKPSTYRFQKCNHQCVCGLCRVKSCPLCRESSKTVLWWVV